MFSAFSSFFPSVQTLQNLAFTVLHLIIKDISYYMVSSYNDFLTMLFLPLCLGTI